MLRSPQIYCILFLLPILPALPVLPDPDPAPIQPFFASSPPSTIPAFPEQSDLSGCPLDLPDDLFPAINKACGRAKNRRLVRARCCPALATWLYSAYSATALGRAGRLPATPYDLPVLPDDSETCVENLEKALRGKGIELLRPNNTCDTVYCYCGIRLHVPSCTDAFVVTEEGRLAGDSRVRTLERECGAGSAVGGCTRCLRSLHQLNGGRGATNGTETDRKKKMHDRDCELMGLTWLLAKNRTAYAPTVSAVLRTIMMSGGNGGSQEPRSCIVGRDGMPLAVDSAELDNPSCSTTVGFPLHLSLILIPLYCICISLLSHL